MPLALAQRINQVHSRLGYLTAIVYGPQGIGKSSYCFQVMDEVFDGDLKLIKKNTVFEPIELIQRIKELQDSDVVTPMILWEDAGLWLYALDWYDPVVKAAVKFFNVARTVTSCMLLNTPDLDFIVRNIRASTGVYKGQVFATDSKGGRMIRLSRQYRMPSGKMTWPSVKMKDSFNVHMPDYIYEWHLPLRKSYAVKARQLMEESIRSVGHYTKPDSTIEVNRPN